MTLCDSHNGHPPLTISRGGKVRKNWEPHQIRHPKVLLDLCPAAGAEGLVALAIVPIKIGHVLHHGDAGDSEFGKHADALCDVDKGELLGSGDDDGRADGDGLAQCELNVTGAWWEVED